MLDLGHGAAAAQLRQPAERRYRLPQRDNVMVMQMFAWDRNPGPVALRSFLGTRAREGRRHSWRRAVGDGAGDAVHRIEHRHQGAMRLLDQPAPPAGEEIRSSIQHRVARLFHGDGRAAARRPPARSTRRRQRAARRRDQRSVRGTLSARRQPDRPARRDTARPASRRRLEIVGVVGALRHERLDTPPRAEILIPYAQSPTGSITLVARTSVDPATLIETAKREIWTIDPLQTFYRTATLEELVDRTLITRRFALIVLTGFAGLALLLAAAGLYGVLSTIASQYRREIGVRMALGAAWLDILQLVVMRGLGRVGGRRRRRTGRRDWRREAVAGVPVQRDADGSGRDRRRGAIDADDRRDCLLHPGAASRGRRSGAGATSRLRRGCESRWGATRVLAGARFV